ncbi:MAG TPA: hypothetical protein VFX19_05335 [Dehalococcoidia bacterium]|nr:hypothetical protein [Dehalococcoidia bacterium]
MPDQQRHREAAEHNEHLARELLRDTEGGWAAVLTFYSALHYIDSFLATRGHHPRNHGERRGYISRLGPLREIYPDYRTLESRSRDARYGLLRITPALAQSLLDRELSDVKHLIARLTHEH